MKVLKPGVDRLGKWKKVVICDGRACMFENKTKSTVPCGAQLEINYKDIFVKSSPIDAEDKKFVFKCPDCGSYTCLRISDIPNYILDYASKRSEKDIDEDKEIADSKDYINLE